MLQVYLLNLILANNGIRPYEVVDRVSDVAFNIDNRLLWGNNKNRRFKKKLADFRTNEWLCEEHKYSALALARQRQFAPRISIGLSFHAAD